MSRRDDTSYINPTETVMNRSEYSANLDMQRTERAGWMVPAPVRMVRPGWFVRMLLAIAGK